MAVHVLSDMVAWRVEKARGRRGTFMIQSRNFPKLSMQRLVSAVRPVLRASALPSVRSLQSSSALR